MVTVVDIIINQKLMFIFGIIVAILMKIFMSNIKIIDALGFSIMVFLMFSFMTGFLFAMLGYKD